MHEKEEDNTNRNHLLRFVLSCLIVLIVAVILVLAVYFIIKQLGLFLVSILDELSNITSRMDAVVIVALITGTVSIIGVIISSVVAKGIDYKKSREDYLAQKE